MSTWSVASHRPEGTFTAEMWRVDEDGGDLFARVFRREAKSGPRWAVYLRHSERMLSHRAAIWAGIVEAVEAATTEGE